MKTNDTSHQMIDQIVSHSPSLGNEKFFDVRKRISVIDAECQAMKVKITDINIIEKNYLISIIPVNKGIIIHRET